MMRNLNCTHDRMQFRFGVYPRYKHAAIPRLKDRSEVTAVATWVGVTHVPVLKIAKGS